MGLANGVHHLAIATRDMKGQVEFFTQVCGMDLVAMYWMHGIENTVHAFLRLDDYSSLALVQSPEMQSIEPALGVSHPGFSAGNVAGGAMQHVAFNVDSEAELMAMRDRLRTHGHFVMGPIDHGMCLSIYATAPEGLMIEFSTSCRSHRCRRMDRSRGRRVLRHRRVRPGPLSAAGVLRLEGWHRAAARPARQAELRVPRRLARARRDAPAHDGRGDRRGAQRADAPGAEEARGERLTSSATGGRPARELPARKQPPC